MYIVAKLEECIAVTESDQDGVRLELERDQAALPALTGGSVKAKEEIKLKLVTLRGHDTIYSENY